jgi:tetratricopeptide (TPR) repeat protein
LFFIVSCIFLPDSFAGNEFAEQFKAYRVFVESGAASLKQGNYTQAITAYSNAIEKSPFDALLYYNRGIAYYKSGNKKGAEEDFSKSIILDSGMNTAYIYRSMCREGLGKYKEALTDYTAALNLKKDDPIIHNNLAWLYASADNEEIRNKTKALEHAKKAAELSREKNAEILDTLAKAYFINEQPKEAIEAENKAIQLEPNNTRYKENLRIYGQSNE